MLAVVLSNAVETSCIQSKHLQNKSKHTDV